MIGELLAKNCASFDLGAHIAEPAFYEVAEEELQTVARPRWVVRIVIPDGTTGEVVTACADAVQPYLSLDQANIAAVFGYRSYVEVGDVYTTLIGNPA